MPAPNVDMVFVIDASESMRPCFEGLRKNIKSLINPMQGYISRMRFGVVTHSIVTYLEGGYGYQMAIFAAPNNSTNCLGSHYFQAMSNDALFSDNINELIQFLDKISPNGDEDSLLALDCALDFPFGPVSNTKRIVALFSDEPFETGVFKNHYPSKIPDLIDKIHARHIQLYVAMPDGPTVQLLSEANGSEVELIQGSDGLASVDFHMLLGQMGKSISASMIQATGKGQYTRDLFGQNRFVESQSRFAFVENK